MKPTVSHKLNPNKCAHCQKMSRFNGKIWCKQCIEIGVRMSRKSMKRQIKRGRSNQNWKPGDPMWWYGSGCYE